jgi:uncharacterized protein (TIGR03790 family)
MRTLTTRSSRRKEALINFALATIKLSLLTSAATIRAFGDTGADVVVIFNSRMPESKEVAEYYAKRRNVPTNQVWGVELSPTEAITRTDYLEKIQTPILKKLEDSKLWVWGLDAPSGSAGRKLASAKVKYAVLCYGVPTKFLQDTNLVEKGTETARPELRRNEASVDSQLACLPLVHQQLRWAGAINNHAYGATNAATLHPTNGIFLVTRLDGPSVEVAGGLIDKAIDAETNGLWGRVYIDSRGITNGEYRLGDDWMRATAQLARQVGFDTDVDQDSNTYPAGYPMSHIAFYAGWYDWNASGPFTRPQVEFMNGAFAYHLHSFSAQTLRSTNQNWVGPLLAKGATCTMGNVDEPYLAATPDIPTFFSRFVMLGFSFGEAAWASQNSLSWQTVAVGDPLYRPFGRKAEELHRDLERRRLGLVEWSVARIINVNLASGTKVDELISQLEEPPAQVLTKQSAVLTEKLADLYWAKKNMSDAFDYYEAALSRHASPQQKARILLLLAHRRTLYGPDEKALEHYRQFLKEFPDYPDRLTIYRKALPLAQKVGDKTEVERCQAEIKRLSAAPVAQ